MAAGQTVKLPFTDPALPGEIAINKTDDAGNPLAGATFTVYSLNTIETPVGTVRR